MRLMTYYESAAATTITKERAIKELDKHGVPTSEHKLFFLECGEKSTYEAQEVLEWLGY